MQLYLKKKSIAILLLVAITVFWIYVSGKDISWDLINYHLYSAQLLIENRWNKDYFAGGIQTYLNPVAYIPIYYAVKFHIPDYLVGLYLSIPAIVAIPLLWSFSEKIFINYQEKFEVIFLAVLLCVTTSLWLVVIGSTFVDSLSLILILGAINFLLYGGDCSRRKYFLSGLLLGTAIGLKLTNGMYAFALLFMVLVNFCVSVKNIRFRCIAIVIFCTAVLIGFVLVHGFWSYKLWSEFSNPFFPFFNGLFKSSDFPAYNLQDRRFMGSGLIGAITLPFEMMKISSWVYSEAPAPEMKISVFFVLLSLVVFAKLVGLLKFTDSNFVTNDVEHRNLVSLIGFFLISYFVWVVSSKIGRYALTLWVTSGVLIAAVMLYMFKQQYVKIFLSVLLCVQIFSIYSAQITRWTPVKWTGSDYLNIKVPENYQRGEYTFLSASLISNSAVAMFINKESSWINVAGQYSIAGGVRMPKRLQEKIDGKKVVGIMPAYFSNLGNYSGIQDIEKTIFNDVYGAYGLGLSEGACEPIEFVQEKLNLWNPVQTKGDDSVFLHACPLKKISSDDYNRHRVNLEKFDNIFSQIEDKCSALFQPNSTSSIKYGPEVSRYYYNTSAYLYSEDGSILVRFPQQMVRSVVANFDRQSRALTSDVICPKYPEKLYLD
ncbi:hypothetical protein [Comamonas sp.]|uniref:hypothetical protein n=1 Tax=Comamonas sp. TaxID=34028 RepID=UPI0028B0EEC6|nr:hypothetical protein [Comamonas sp.]